MKTLLLIVVFLQCLVYSPLEAQIQKGNILIGTSSNLLGNLNQLASSGLSNNAGIQFGKIETEYTLLSGTTFSTKTSLVSFNISPSIGGFVSDQILVGASVGFVFYQLKDEDNEKDRFTVLSFSPYVRTYFKKEGKTLPYAEVRGGLTSLKFKGEEGAATSPFLGIKAGAAIFLNPNISLDLFADYLYGWNKTDIGNGSKISDKQSLFGVGVGLSFFLSKQDASND